MRTKFVTMVLVSAFFAAPTSFGQSLTKSAGGDICSVRPDLCDDQAESAPVQGKSQAFTAHPAQRCRMPGSSISLAQRNLPVCQVQASTRAPAAVSHDAAHDIMWDDPVPTTKRLVQTRKPASASASVSFADYMNSNASHPALHAKIKDHQKAFAETAGTAVISFPTNEGSTREDNLVVNAPLPGASPGGAPGANAGTPR